MRVYLVTVGDDLGLSVLKEEGARIMLSYGCCRSSVHQILPHFNSAMLDSGAYQLQTLGERAPRYINPHQYAAWLMEVLPKYSDKIDGYFTLDMMGNVRETCRNQRILESYGLKPIPVWHHGESLKCLRCFCSHYELVGIGGIAKRHAEKEIEVLLDYLNNCYRGQKFHLLGLGMTAAKCPHFSKLYALDCSTWSLQPARFGHLVAIKDGIPKTIDPGEEKRNELKRNRAKLREALVQSVRAFKALEDSSLPSS